jgi:hypothetical protein
VRLHSRFALSARRPLRCIFVIDDLTRAAITNAFMYCVFCDELQCIELARTTAGARATPLVRASDGWKINLNRGFSEHSDFLQVVMYTTSR